MEDSSASSNTSCGSRLAGLARAQDQDVFVLAAQERLLPFVRDVIRIGFGQDRVESAGHEFRGGYWGHVGVLNFPLKIFGIIEDTPRGSYRAGYFGIGGLGCAKRAYVCNGVCTRSGKRIEEGEIG